MEWVTLIGLLGACLTTFAFFPQVIKSWKSKKTGDLSLLLTICTTLGVSLWFVYGVLIGDLPLLLANGITFLFVSSLLIMKLRWG